MISKETVARLELIINFEKAWGTGPMSQLNLSFQISKYYGAYTVAFGYMRACF